MTINSGSFFEQQIATFAAEPPHTTKPYSSRAWGHGLHSLSSYQGKLKPALAHWLVNRFTSIDEAILDPLGGVGTVAFEAGLSGRKAYTCDLSPFASSVARGKVAPPSLSLLEHELDSFFSDVEDADLTEEDYRAAEFGLNAKVKDYYHSETLIQVLKARKLLMNGELSKERNFVKAVLLHILHGNRPYALSRTSHPITPFNPTGDFEFRDMNGRIAERCRRLLNLPLPPQFVPGTAFHSDFRNLVSLLDRTIDAVICSPPFPGMRFDRPNWLRMWFCGWLETDFHNTSKRFLERQQGRTFEVYNEYFAICNEVLNPGGRVILHVGGSKGYDMAQALKKIGMRYLRYSGMISEAVDHVEKHGIVDKGLTSAHLLLFFERA
ncbi:hypothetical protein MK632_20195 [Rhizobium changzhiense]|uniref:hypothetical protein n=1 Tax=Rhizobium changzhiense TaxID=2692317 RepID=UPI001F0C5EAA|nr:hypothetical protein [Rhizobium changzhiense]MCH4548062.1 hypothetical protein [Rhizobium changzhiense]